MLWIASLISNDVMPLVFIARVHQHQSIYWLCLELPLVQWAMGLLMRRVDRIDRACAVCYRQLSDISVAVRH